MDRCPACPNKYKCIPFSGPANSPIKLIGEGPGWDEEKKGEVFVGKTGREVNEGYMPLAGLRRPNVRIGNAIACFPDNPEHKIDLKKPKHKLLLESCAQHILYRELEENPASLLVPMGAFACYALDPGIDLEMHHGIPYQTKWGMAFPMYHPAGGIHEPKKMLQIRTDWYRLKRYLRGELQLGVDEYAGIEDYGVTITPEDVYNDLSPYQYSPLACDTEIKGKFFKRDPFCLSYSTRAGFGRLITADNRPALDEFQNCIDQWEGPILWHNWLFDKKVTRNMGLVFPRRLIVDTMVRVFHLGNLPQGLKALAFRELGMDMLDFDDLVKPHSTDRILRYYGDAAREDWPKPAPTQERQADGSFKTHQGQSMKTKLKTFFTSLKKNPDKDVFEMWTKNWVDEQAMVEERMGEWPGKCITHAAEDDWPKVIRYACRDADALRRFWDVLLHMESRVRKAPQEQWREVA